MKARNGTIVRMRRPSRAKNSDTMIANHEAVPNKIMRNVFL